ncbi:uncharacterized protein J3D65DRAFT_26825 [Phyllosticta citribraziliensis]|uniref:Uncharacterized protein n=1 Tax=Phyllosticta citribraziliensis TaxID=989973 RepID=A0ABR1M9N7_9PEZI
MATCCNAWPVTGSLPVCNRHWQLLAKDKLGPVPRPICNLTREHCPAMSGPCAIRPSCHASGGIARLPRRTAAITETRERQTAPCCAAAQQLRKWSRKLVCEESLWRRSGSSDMIATACWTSQSSLPRLISALRILRAGIHRMMQQQLPRRENRPSRGSRHPRRSITFSSRPGCVRRRAATNHHLPLSTRARLDVSLSSQLAALRSLNGRKTHPYSKSMSRVI